jgi:hypothetical protein
MNEVVSEPLFDVEKYIESYGKIDRYFDQNDDVSILERLGKKVDVVKKVYTCYSLDLKKRASEKEISEKHYLIFMNILKNNAFETRDFKRLNTYLKLLDILKSKDILDNKGVSLQKVEAKASIQTWIKG